MKTGTFPRTGLLYLGNLFALKKRIAASLAFSTKRVRRYHTPTIKQKLEERARYQEMLQAEARAAFQDFLAEITQNHYALMRDVVNKLAVADCLLSLALVAVKGASYNVGANLGSITDSESAGHTRNQMTAIIDESQTIADKVDERMKTQR